MKFVSSVSQRSKRALFETILFLHSRLELATARWDNLREWFAISTKSMEIFLPAVNAPQCLGRRKMVAFNLAWTTWSMLCAQHIASSPICRWSQFKMYRSIATIKYHWKSLWTRNKLAGHGEHVCMAHWTHSINTSINAHHSYTRRCLRRSWGINVNNFSR